MSVRKRIGFETFLLDDKRRCRGDVVRQGCRLFQRQLPATANARSPTVVGSELPAAMMMTTAASDNWHQRHAECDQTDIYKLNEYSLKKGNNDQKLLWSFGDIISLAKMSFFGRIECIMRPIATDDSVAFCVSLSVTRLRCAKMTERIEILFRAETFGKLRTQSTLYEIRVPIPYVNVAHCTV